MLSTPKTPIAKRAGDWWKRNGNDAVIGTAFVLVAILAFFAGQISIVSRTKNPVVIEVPSNVLAEQTELESRGELSAKLATGESTAAPKGIAEAERKGNYVASKNGKYYYTADMYMATRISPKNRVWFSSAEEAASRGFKPAKGIEE